MYQLLLSARTNLTNFLTCIQRTPSWAGNWDAPHPRNVRKERKKSQTQPKECFNKPPENSGPLNLTQYGPRLTTGTSVWTPNQLRQFTLYQFILQSNLSKVQEVICSNSENRRSCYLLQSLLKSIRFSKSKTNTYSCVYMQINTHTHTPQKRENGKWYVKNPSCTMYKSYVLGLSIWLYVLDYKIR